MQKCRVLKAARTEREAVRVIDGSDTIIGAFKFMRAAEYLKDQPKYRNVGASGESSDGHRAMSTARKLLSMGAGPSHRQRGVYRTRTLKLEVPEWRSLYNAETVLHQEIELFETVRSVWVTAPSLVA